MDTHALFINGIPAAGKTTVTGARSGAVMRGGACSLRRAKKLL
jgi:hypothetical protein